MILFIGIKYIQLTYLTYSYHAYLYNILFPIINSIFYSFNLDNLNVFFSVQDWDDRRKKAVILDYYKELNKSGIEKPSGLPINTSKPKK